MQAAALYCSIIGASETGPRQVTTQQAIAAQSTVPDKADRVMNQLPSCIGIVLAVIVTPPKGHFAA
jgi:hypothetical protein